MPRSLAPKHLPIDSTLRDLITSEPDHIPRNDVIVKVQIYSKLWTLNYGSCIMSGWKNEGIWTNGTCLEKDCMNVFKIALYLYVLIRFHGTCAVRDYAERLAKKEQRTSPDIFLVRNDVRSVIFIYP